MCMQTSRLRQNACVNGSRESQGARKPENQKIKRTPFGTPFRQLVAGLILSIQKTTMRRVDQFEGGTQDLGNRNPGGILKET